MDIIYHDQYIVIINKPGGLLSVPGRGKDKQDCVVNRLKGKFINCINQPSVHRLDMDSSGLMVFAFTKEAHRNLSMQFQNRTVRKLYIALLDGVVEADSGEIKLSFRLDPDNRPYQIFDPIHGKEGVSKWKKLQVEGSKSRIEFTPITGRTHQLRLHSSHKSGLGCPISGDRLYGTGQPGDQLMLHATYLAFEHPSSRKALEFHSPPPF